MAEVLLAVLAAGVGAAVAILLTTRRAGARLAAAEADVESLGERQDLVAELRAELQSQRVMLEQQRTDSLNEAVRSVVAIASEQLTQHSAAGTAELDQRNEAVGQRLDDMTKSLERVRSLVTELDQQRAEGYGQLTERLEQTGRITGQLHQTTQALREALASPQARGQWGERMAEDVLRAAGFVKGVNYHVQQATATGRPDFTFPLPAGRCVHMDVKFPLDNYMRHLEATTDIERSTARKAFLRDVANRITEVSRRDYIDPGAGTLDQVLLFLPNEHLYGFLHEADPTILDRALASKVVLCSPLTLFAVLAVIRQSVDDHLTEQRSVEILDLLGGFSMEWDKFTGALEKIGSRLESTRNAFEDVNGPRRRQLQRQLDRIDDVRAASMEDLVDAPVLSLTERSSGHQSVAG